MNNTINTKTFTFRKDFESRNKEILFIILSGLTLGLPMIFFYDEFMLKSYMVNRRRLLKFLRQGQFEFISFKENVTNDTIKSYKIRIQEEVYEIWVWQEKNLTMFSDSNSDIIGLFASTFFAKRLVKELIKEINKFDNVS